MLIIQNCTFLYYSMPLKMPDVGHALGSFVGPGKTNIVLLALSLTQTLVKPKENVRLIMLLKP